VTLHRPEPLSLTQLTNRQAGCFSRSQALGCGLTDETIAANVRARRWSRAHPGVLISFTGPRPYLTSVWAALLAVGPGAVVTRSTALRLFGLSSMANEQHIFIVIDHDRRATAPSGATVRRRRDLASVLHPQRSPPTVRVEEAVLQHAAWSTRPSHGLAVIADACQQGVTSPAKVRSALELLPRLRGRRQWYGVLEDVAMGARSFLEVGYLRRVERAHGLPSPLRQNQGSSDGRRVWRDGEYSDFGVIHELDGRLGHEWTGDQLRDRRRDGWAAASGAVTLRHGYADIMEPCETARLVAATLQARGWRGSPRRCGVACTALN
jgi:hypothetical protein